MSANIKNRELSQFGSFIYIDDATQNVAITSGSSSFVGIGSTLPTSKLDVVGDINITGDLYRNNVPFTASGIATNSNLKTSGIITASAFYVNDILLVNPVLSPWIPGSGSSIYRLSGNVGIGTTNAQYKLDVTGDINFTGTFRQNGSEFVASRWTLGTGNDIYRLLGNVGIGVSSLTEKLTVNGNVSAGRFVSTVASGTAPFLVSSNTLVTNLNADYLRNKAAPTGDIVGTTDTQTLTNKTLTTPSIGSGGANFNGTSGSTNLLASTTASGTLTLPAETGTLVSTGSVGAVTSTMIANGTITDSDISASANIGITKLASSTISGVSLGNNLNTLTIGSYLNGVSYNGSSAITISANASTTNTANTLVARDVSGDFTAGTINCSNLTASFNVSATTVSASSSITSSTISATTISATTISATDFNSTSDIKLKSNVNTIENSLNIVNSLRGVSFDWKASGKKSYGVIAQELEQVLPDLVTTVDNKSVNYNGLVGVLLQAVKELSAEVEELKKKVL